MRFFQVLAMKIDSVLAARSLKTALHRSGGLCRAGEKAAGAAKVFGGGARHWSAKHRSPVLQAIRPESHLHSTPPDMVSMLLVAQAEASPPKVRDAMADFAYLSILKTSAG